jgi:hypothetical protein
MLFAVTRSAFGQVGWSSVHARLGPHVHATKAREPESFIPASKASTVGLSTDGQAAVIDGQAMGAADVSPPDKATPASETGRSGTKEMEPAACGVDTVLAGSSPKRTCTRPDDFMVGVDADTAAKGEEGRMSGEVTAS